MSRFTLAHHEELPKEFGIWDLRLEVWFDMDEDDYPLNITVVAGLSGVDLGRAHIGAVGRDDWRPAWDEYEGDLVSEAIANAGSKLQEVRIQAASL